MRTPLSCLMPCVGLVTSPQLDPRRRRVHKLRSACRRDSSRESRCARQRLSTRRLYLRRHDAFKASAT